MDKDKENSTDETGSEPWKKQANINRRYDDERTVEDSIWTSSTDYKEKEDFRLVGTHGKFKAERMIRGLEIERWRARRLLLPMPSRYLQTGLFKPPGTEYNVYQPSHWDIHHYEILEQRWSERESDLSAQRYDAFKWANEERIHVPIDEIHGKVTANITRIGRYADYGICHKCCSVGTFGQRCIH